MNLHPGSSAPAARGHADPARLKASLAATGQPVTVRETHGSYVFVTADRAYKLRKPVRFDYVDQRDPAVRAAAGQHEIDLGAALAPGVALRLRGVIPAGPDRGYALGAADAAGAVDTVVEMRRFDESDTLRSRILDGRATLAQAGAVGERLAQFHAEAAVELTPVDERALVDRNFEALLPLAATLVPAVDLLALQRFASAFLLASGDVLEARARAGSVVDGHGDLRAEHVLIEEGRVMIVDRLEFDALRRVDVADELGFLLMELGDLSGDGRLGAALLDGYHAAGGAPQPETLLAFFGAYRAQVRAKVTLLRSGQPGTDRRALRDQAAHLLRLSRRLGWRARGRLLVLVTGPPGSGKSTLATALGTQTGLPVLSTDALRRAVSGPVPDYGLHGRARVYTELGRRAAREPAVIVDATFGEPVLHAAFTTALGSDPRRPLVVECTAPRDVRVARAERRARAGDSASDADGTIALRADEQCSGLPGPGSLHLALGTQAPLELQVDRVSSWLDSLLAEGGMP